MRCYPLIFILFLGCEPSTSMHEVEMSSIELRESDQVTQDTSVKTSVEETSTPAAMTKEAEKVPIASRSKLQFVQPPQWKPHPFERTPLVEVIHFSLAGQSVNSLDQNAKCTILVFNGEESWSFIRELQTLRINGKESLSNEIAEYEVKLFGLMPDTTYRVAIKIQRESSNESLESKLTAKTQPVSPLFPRIQVKHVREELMEPGLTLFNLIRWENDKPDTDFGAIVAIDSGGVIRWSYVAPHLIFIVRQLENGNLLYGYGNRTDGLIEIDLTGEIVRQWDAAQRGRSVAAHAIPVEVDSLHHDVFPTESQTYIALTTTLHEMRPYYDPEYHPRKRIEKAAIVADEVVEFSLDGKILRKHSLFNALDPHRIGYGSLHGFWNSRGYEDVADGTFDWSHSNSVVIDPRDNNIIVSVRHQDAVIKIDRKSGELIWILGTPKGWRAKFSKKLLRPVRGLKWPYHQHAVEVTPQGTLLMFDNGNYQSVPFDEQLPAAENQSRVVEFRVDEVGMKVEQVWEYAGEADNQFYSTFLCDVDWLPGTKNVLITNGGEIRDEGGKQTDAAPGDKQWAEIFEVTYGDNSEKIFEVIIDSPPGQPNVGWSIYRAERIADLFQLN